MKSKWIIFIVAISVTGFALAGCTHKTRMYEPSTEHKHVTGLREADTTDLFWGKATLDLPLVKYEDVRSGEFDDCWILIDGILADISMDDKGRGPTYMNVLFELQDGNFHSEEYTMSNGLFFLEFDDFSEKGKIKDKVRMCIKVKDHSLSKGYLYGLAATGQKSKIDLGSVIIETETEWIPPETTMTESAETEKPLTGNPLLDAEEYSGLVKSGAGEILGVYRYKNISRAAFDAVPEDQYDEFCQYVMSLSDTTNWYTVNFDDGTAILYAACAAYAGTIGHQDGEGSISDAIGYITYEDGSYVYENAE